MSMIKDFKAFVARGNVLDLAVGIIIGAAFGKIVTSLVNDVLMPPIGMMVGGVDFSTFVITLREATATTPAVVVRYGLFVNTIIDFLIVALAIFMLIRAVARIYRKQAEQAPPPAPTREELLLTEIRDLLREGVYTESDDNR